MDSSRTTTQVRLYPVTLRARVLWIFCSLPDQQQLLGQAKGRVFIAEILLFRVQVYNNEHDADRSTQGRDSCARRGMVNGMQCGGCSIQAQFGPLQAQQTRVHVQRSNSIKDLKASTFKANGLGTLHSAHSPTLKIAVVELNGYTMQHLLWLFCEQAMGAILWSVSATQEIV